MSAFEIIDHDHDLIMFDRRIQALWKTSERIGFHNSGIGYLEDFSQMGIKMFECRPENIPNRNHGVHFTVFIFSIHFIIFFFFFWKDLSLLMKYH